MTPNPPLPEDQEQIRETYIPIFEAWLTEELGNPDTTIQFDHAEKDGVLVGFEWNTTDGRRRGLVTLETLDKYLNRYTATFHGGVNHGEIETGQGEPASAKTIEHLDVPNPRNNHTPDSESTLYKLHIVDGRYEYHAEQSWFGSPPQDALD